MVMLTRVLNRSFATKVAKKAAKKPSGGQLVIRRRGEFLYGVGPCTAALEAGRRKVYAVYQKPGHLEKKAASKRVALGEGRVRKLAEELKVDFTFLDRSGLDKLCGNRPHQGIVLDVAPLNFRRMSIEDSKLSEKERSKNPLWVLLDEVQDPMNLGAILRCCYYLGVQRVITSLKKCCPLSPAVSKASAGAMELMPVHTVSHLENFLKEARTNGWKVLGTAGPEYEDPRDAESWHQKERKIIPRVDCTEYKKEDPTLLALGNEGSGLHREVEQQCEALMTVGACRSLPPGFDSLNVAVAAGIILHSLQKPHQ